VLFFGLGVSQKLQKRDFLRLAAEKNGVGGALCDIYGGNSVSATRSSSKFVDNDAINWVRIDSTKKILAFYCPPRVMYKYISMYQPQLEAKS